MGFLRPGSGIEIGISPRRPPKGDVRVWVIDTESRDLPEAAARRRVRNALDLLRRWGAGFIYKKVDSALRGPVGPELDAFLSRLRLKGPQKLAFVPAFPRAGRTTKNRRQYVEGRPLHKSIFARDPLHPRETSSLVRLLGPKVSERLWIPDVADQKSLRKAARACLQGRAGNIAVLNSAAAGAAALAQAISQRWASGGRPGAGRRRAARAKPRVPVMVVVGSANPVSRGQLKELQRRKRPGMVAVFSPEPRKKNPKAILVRTVRRALALARERSIRHFVATGGQTAAEMSRLWGISRWRVAQKQGTGIAAVRPVPTHKDVRALVLKPGGFGRENALARLARALRSAPI